LHVGQRDVPLIAPRNVSTSFRVRWNGRGIERKVRFRLGLIRFDGVDARRSREEDQDGAKDVQHSVNLAMDKPAEHGYLSMPKLSPQWLGGLLLAWNITFGILWTGLSECYPVTRASAKYGHIEDFEQRIALPGDPAPSSSGTATIHAADR